MLEKREYSSATAMDRIGRRSNLTVELNAQGRVKYVSPENLEENVPVRAEVVRRTPARLRFSSVKAMVQVKKKSNLSVELNAQGRVQALAVI